MSRETRKRLPWFDHYQAHGGNAALTCRYFGISREAFYRWKRRYDPQQLSTLEDRSHQPHQALGYLTPQQFLAQTPIPQKGP